MLVRRPTDVIGTNKEMIRRAGDGCVNALRVLTKEDGCGFSISDVYLQSGFSMELHYKNHAEINLILAGHVKVQDLTQGEHWKLNPGDAYLVGPKDRHHLSTNVNAHLISIFNPAILGNEQHDSDGSLEPTGELPLAWKPPDGRRMYTIRATDANQMIPVGDGHQGQRYLDIDGGFGLTVYTHTLSVREDSILLGKDHLGTSYVIEGEGTLEDTNTSDSWEIEPGCLYLVRQHDRCKVNVKTDIHLVTITNLEPKQFDYYP